MNNQGTLLALQLENGVRMYDVRFGNANGNLSRKTYRYKSDLHLEPGDYVVVPVNVGNSEDLSFAVARVNGLTETINFDAEYPYRWVTGRLDFDPSKVREAQNNGDERALSKLAQAHARKVAADYLKQSGLEGQDWKALAAPSDDGVDEAIVIEDDEPEASDPREGRPA